LILLDTNVISELMKVVPNPAVDMWFAANQQDTAIPAPALGEIAFGIAKLPVGAKQKALEARLAEWRVRYADRMVAFTETSAMFYGKVMADALAASHNMSAIDGQIAAIALERNATVATRNMRDFKFTTAVVINPWSA
jgi:toxin FitB